MQTRENFLFLAVVQLSWGDKRTRITRTIGCRIGRYLPRPLHTYVNASCRIITGISLVYRMHVHLLFILRSCEYAVSYAAIAAAAAAPRHPLAIC